MNMEQKVQAGTCSPVQKQLVSAVDRAELCSKPFDYIFMSEILDPSSYQALLARMPARHFYHDLKHKDALRKDGSSTRLRMYLYPELLRRLPKEQRKVWVPLSRALCSRELELSFKRKFRRALEERFEKPVEKIGLYPVPILLRDQPRYRIGIRNDVEKKAITVQFYLPADDSQKHVGTVFHESKRGPGSRRTRKMPFMPASGYAFPIALARSWHSAAATTLKDGERVSMMVTYYVADSLAQRLYWKVRRALLSLGVHSER